MSKLYFEGKDVDTMSLNELRKAIKVLANINDVLREKLRKANEEYLLGK